LKTSHYYNLGSNISRNFLFPFSLFLILFALNSTELSANQPLSKYEKPCVTLDAGHGGHDPGTNNKSYEVLEKDLVLDLTLEVQKILESDGASVKLTRKTDTFIALEDRIKIAHTNGCAKFVSIHLNSFNTKIEGFETYYGLKRVLSFAVDFHNFLAQFLDSPNRGVKFNDFKVIRDPPIDPEQEDESSVVDHSLILQAMYAPSLISNIDYTPNPTLKAILVEPYFLDNDTEIDKYWKQDHLGRSIAESIKQASSSDQSNLFE